MSDVNPGESSTATRANSISRDRVPLPTDRLWTVRQAAAFLGRSVSWVYKAAERGELPRARGMGWGLRFVPAQLHAYANGMATPVPDVVPIRRGTTGGR